MRASLYLQGWIPVNIALFIMYYPFHDPASTSLSKNTVDRNFDDLSEKFARKVYGGLKGDIRLAVIWRDLRAVLPHLESQAPQAGLRVLDIGGGLGQLTVTLAKLGHQVVYNDLSQQMLEAAQKLAQEAGVLDQIIWHQQPYQALKNEGLGQFDLVMSHALIEWLAKPELLIADLESYLKPDGLLSLTFYNQNALVYRNLIRGNFNVLQGEFSAHPKSLTPGEPLQPDTVQQWVDQAELATDYSSGIRVFHDYVTTQRGGHEDGAAVIDMELRYSRQEPFKWLGRYIHFICSKTTSTDTKKPYL